MIPSLREVHLRGCSVKTLPMFLPHVNLSSLVVLDLSINSITLTSIPQWLLNITSFRYLDLSSNGFSGNIPDDFKNMLSLEHLSLSMNNFKEGGGVPPALGDNLCNLRELGLKSCSVKGDFRTGLEGVLCGCMKNKVEVLDLSDNNLTGSFPDWLGGLSMLKYLAVDGNSLSGPIPKSLGNLSYMEELYLDTNSFNGTFPFESIFVGLSYLKVIDISYNSLRGTITKSHLSHLNKLETLHLGVNSFVFDVSTHWVPPFRLTSVDLSFCKVGPRFPSWIRLQEDVGSVNLQNTGISDGIPDWFFDSTRFIFILDLLHNSIRGDIFGTIIGTGDKMRTITKLSISFNNLHGSSIPASLCNLTDLSILMLSNNELVGGIPDCWTNMSRLEIMDLSNNNLTGRIPESIGPLPILISLHLNNNQLSGELPNSLMMNCGGGAMEVLDLGDNHLNGSLLQKWPAECDRLSPPLKVLRLRSNSFSGTIPPQLSSLPHLQVLDLAHNNCWGKTRDPQRRWERKREKQRRRRSFNVVRQIAAYVHG